jgi:alpha-mannosidase
MSCLEVSSDNLIVAAIKQAEDGEGNLLRCYEMNGETVETSVKLFGKPIEFAVSHHEIKTVDEGGKALDLLEREEKSK